MVRVDEERCGISRDQLMACLKDMGIGSGLHFRAVHSQKILSRTLSAFVFAQHGMELSQIVHVTAFPRYARQ